ncbi:MAG: hypothetical protein ACI35T_00450 [Alistipes sp.]
MNRELQKRVARIGYATPVLRICNCLIERGFAGSSDFNDLDFDKRDEE